MSDDYEVIAVRFGSMETSRSETFYRYGVYGEPDRSMRMDYFFWIVSDGDSITLVDTGFHPDAIRSRPGRTCLAPPVEALATLGISPEDVDRVVITHFHYDHIGNVSAFPKAEVILQRRELDFWLGPYGSCKPAAASVEAAEIEFIRTAVEQGRVTVLEGDAVIAPGIEVQLTPGHCPGQQVVVINNEQPIVLASDALHFYEEMERDMPFEIFTDLEGMCRTFALLRSLEADGARIVAGHDPDVIRRFGLVNPASDLAVRIS